MCLVYAAEFVLVFVDLQCLILRLEIDCETVLAIFCLGLRMMLCEREQYSEAIFRALFDVPAQT